VVVMAMALAAVGIASAVAVACAEFRVMGAIVIAGVGVAVMPMVVVGVAIAVVIVIAVAAGGKCERHGERNRQGQDKYENFFHVSPPKRYFWYAAHARSLILRRSIFYHVTAGSSRGQSIKNRYS